MQNFARTVRLICLALFLPACAGTQLQDQKTRLELLAEKGYLQGETVDSIPSHQISGWEYLDPGSIILSGVTRQKYLVVFTLQCRDLRWSEALATTSTNSQLTVFDTVLTRRTGGEAPIHCPIQYLYTLDSVETAS